MRLDKYLKISRIIKRRTVANEACDAGRVLVNGKIARASYDVKVGDAGAAAWRPCGQGGGAQRQRVCKKGRGGRDVPHFRGSRIISALREYI